MIPDLIGRSASDISRFPRSDQNDIIHQISVLRHDSAISNFSCKLDLEIESNWNGLDRIDEYFDQSKISELIDSSDDSDSTNAYLITCIELGSIIGNNLVNADENFEWLAELPYWETAIWHPPSGKMIPPVHFAIKKLSSYGWADGLEVSSGNWQRKQN